MDIDQSLLDEFSIEASELLDEAEEGLLKISDTADIKNIYALVFRAFHSLKGSSGMIGFDELQRHLHLLEDYLQKSQNDHKHFIDSTDYYLKGIDAARKILKGEVVQFVYEVTATKETKSAQPTSKTNRNKILYLSNSGIKKQGEVILSFESELNFLLKFSSVDELENKNLHKEDYDILISDLSIEFLKTLISPKKNKYPIINIVETIDLQLPTENIFQILKTNDETVRVKITLRSAIDAFKKLEMYERAKGLIMYMYSDLENYLIETKKLDTQKTLNAEIKHFVSSYSRL